MLIEVTNRISTRGLGEQHGRSDELSRKHRRSATRVSHAKSTTRFSGPTRSARGALVTADADLDREE
jgi:hypothetical protein